MKIKRILLILNIILFVIGIIVAILDYSFINKNILIFDHLISVVFLSIVILNISFIIPIKKENKREYIKSKSEFISRLEQINDLDPIRLAICEIYAEKNEKFNEIVNQYGLSINHNINELKQRYTLKITSKIKKSRFLNIMLIYNEAYSLKINNEIIDKSFSDSYEVIEYILDTLKKYENEILECKKYKEVIKKVEFKIFIVGCSFLSGSWLVFLGAIVLALFFTVCLFFLLVWSGDVSVILKTSLYSITISIPLAIASFIIGFISLIIAFKRKNETVKKLAFLLILFTVISMIALVFLLNAVYNFNN